MPEQYTPAQQQLANNANIPAGQAGSPWSLPNTPTVPTTPTTPVVANPTPQNTSTSLNTPPKTGLDIMSLLMTNVGKQDKLLTDVAGYMTPTEEETTAQKNLTDSINKQQNFDVSYEGGLGEILKKPIAMDFQQGQAAALTRDAAFTRSSLARQVDANTRVLQSAQTTRQQKLEAAKFLYDANRNSLSDTIMLMKATAPENIGNVVDPQTGEMTVIMKNPVDGTITRQNLGVVQTPQRVIDNMKLAQEAGVNQPFFSRDGKTVINTQNGREYSSIEQAAADGVDTKSWSNVQWGVKSLPQQQLDLQREQLAQSKFSPFKDDAGNLYGFDAKTGKFTLQVGQPTSSDLGDGGIFSEAAASLGVNMTAPQRKDFNAKVNNLYAQGKYDEASEFIINTAINSTDAATKSKLRGYYTGEKKLGEIQDLLAEFRGAGGDTNIFTGTAEQVAQKIGTTSNKKAAYIAGRINAALAAYINSVSGQAFTEQERNFYTSLFPGIGKTGDLNDAKIQSLRDDMNSSMEGNLETIIGPGAYQRLKNGGSEMLWNQAAGGEGTGAPLVMNGMNDTFGGGLTFDGNQVKGTSSSVGKANTINYSPQKVALIGEPNQALFQAASKKFPEGSTGGQCGDFVRKIANTYGLNYPSLGDSLQSKINAVKKYGTSTQNAGVGSVIVTKENPTYGHVAWIIGKSPTGWIVAESNFKQSNKISYGREIPFNSTKVVGVINPRLT